MKEIVVKDNAADLWWLGVVTGIVTIFFGIAALFWPGLTLATFVVLFSAFVLVLGITAIIKSLVSIKTFTGTWWFSLVFGVLALGLGVYLIRHPGVSFETLVLFVGFTFIVRGVFDVMEGIFGGRTSGTNVLYFIGGVLGVLAGIFMLNQPVAGGVAFVWILGLYALFMGPLLIAMSVKEHEEVVTA